MVNRRLLKTSLRSAPAQPATAFWRAIEIEHVVAEGGLPGTGRGLDLGCGDGVVTQLVRDELGARWSLAGLDDDEAELRLAAASGVYERVLHSKGSSIDAPDGSFDFVLANSVLEHIEDVEATMSEVGRVLRPGGRLVFTVPVRSFHENLGKPGVLARVATGQSTADAYHLEVDKRLAHVRYLDLDDWRLMLTSCGLDVVHTSSYLTAKETRRWAAASNATAGLLVRVVGRTDRPIDVQRRLGLKKGRPPRWLQFFGSAIGQLAAIGLDGESSRGANSCLLVVADRR